MAHSLDAIFSPKNVAVVGATETAGSVGRTLLSNLLSNPFGGVVFPVNPKRPSVLGIRAYPNIAAVPERVDLAVIATPAPTVPEVIRQCAAAGVRGAIVISAGFKELGPGGAELEVSPSPLTPHPPSAAGARLESNFLSVTVQYGLKDKDDPEKAAKRKQLTKAIAGQIRPLYQDAMKALVEQRREAEAGRQAQLVAKVANAVAERQAFEDKLLSQTYRPNFKATNGLLAITVIPAEPHLLPIPDDVFYFQRKLSPVGIEDRANVKQAMNSAFCFWPLEDNAKDHSLDRIAELNYLTGSVYSVRDLLYRHDLKTPTASDPTRIRLRQFEHAITKAVLRYINMLKELGVQSPYFVGLSLLNVRWFKVKHGEWDGSEWVITDHDSPNIQTVTRASRRTRTLRHRRLWRPS
jgi:predicted CoA-binding protein